MAPFVPVADPKIDFLGLQYFNKEEEGQPPGKRLIPADFRLREDHQRYSIQNRQYDNLLEVVETPRDSSGSSARSSLEQIRASFFYKESTAKKYKDK